MHYKEQKARQDDTLTWFMFVWVACRPGKMTHSPGVCLCGVQARQDDTLTWCMFVWRAGQAR